MNDIINFSNKYNTFNLNYESIKKIIKNAVKNKMVITGSGGSDNIIIINNNIVVKIIPNIYNPLLKKSPNHDYLEGQIYLKLTNEFLLQNKTPHIVGVYKRYILEDINYIFPEYCPNLDETLLQDPSKMNPSMDKLCMLKKGYNKKLVGKKASLLVLENCPTNISFEVEMILGSSQKLKIKLELFRNLIRRVIFQFIFTLAVIREKYPKFIHNDMFLRNVLGIYEHIHDPDDYVQYNFQGKSYYLPANGLYIKINDFGYSLNILDNNSTLENEIKNSLNSNFEIENPIRDVYTFLFDLYNGPGLGSISLMTLIYQQIKSKKMQNMFFKILRKEISKFINYQIIDKIHNKNMGILDWQWDISESKLLSKSVMPPQDYFKKNSFDYYTRLPKNGRIIKIINS
jgi:hypothetical protein